MSDMLNGWYYGPEYGSLSQAEKEHNANLAMTALRTHGFTIFAAAGVVGNMWAESMMNPGLWQGGSSHAYGPGRGYGLVQWTPWNDYWPWPAGSTDWLNNGPRQMERLIYERDHNQEFWHNTTTMPGWSWSTYCAIENEPPETENQTVNKAAEVFVYRYLAPADPAGTLSNRQYHARYVYNNCPGHGGGGIGGGWLPFKIRQRNFGIYI